MIRSAAGPGRRRIFERGDVIGAGALIACMVVSVIAADGAALKVVVAALGLCAELGMVLSGRALPTPLTWFGVALTIGTGFAVMALVHNGLGEVPVLAAAAVLPMCIPAGPVRNACVALLAVGFGVAVMLILNSVAGLLSAVGVWLLADRSIEHAALQAERDRAVALLAEVEASRASRQEAAALEERRRIAHELHDVLAHSLAGLSMQLQAIRAIARRDGVPATLTGPLDRAAELARDGGAGGPRGGERAAFRTAPGRGRYRGPDQGFSGRGAAARQWPGRSAHTRGRARGVPGGAGGHDERGAVRDRQRHRGGPGVGGLRAARCRAGPWPAGRSRPVRSTGQRHGAAGHGRADRGRRRLVDRRTCARGTGLADRAPCARRGGRRRRGGHRFRGCCRSGRRGRGRHRRGRHQRAWH
ncbi:hypothetical protein GXW82_35260 [Streptacidiphilus sp. 4-A2]|nr:hypothetical protein [Streptacidiphilus sp. 4-A2]